MQVVFALSRARRKRLTECTLGCRLLLFKSEAELLRAALEYVKQQDPDALVLFQARPAWPSASAASGVTDSPRSLSRASR